MIAWTALVSGATPDLALANAASVMSDLRYAGSVPRFVEYRPEGASYSTLFEARGPAAVQLNYNWAQFVGAGSTLVDITIPVAPLTRGLPLDMTDDFSTDTEADYTFDASAAADVATTGGAMTPVVGAALSVERRARHTVRGYTHLDCQVTAHGAPGSTITSFKLGRVLRGSSGSTYVEVYVDDNGTNSRLRVDVVIAGARTNRASTNLAARVSNGTEFWVRGRIEGNVVYSEYFTAAPTPSGTPTLSGTAYTLTPTEQVQLVAGYAGWSWVPQQAAAVVYDLQDEPYTYTGRSLPEEWALRGTIPGDAPALADITITPSGGSAAPIFALVGWTDRPAVHNWCWNGDFEDDANGWSVTLPAFWLNTGTSITRVTTFAKYGSASGQVVCPATTSTGAAFAFYKRFKQGITYTADVWLRSTSQTTNIQIVLGAPSANSGQETASALSATFVKHTVTWIPTADVDVAYVVARITAATATTFQIDGVAVYEGTTPPTVGRQVEGAGGVPPFGVLEAEACDAGDLTGWAITADAGSRTGNYLFDGTVSGAETYTAGWWLDPNLLLADDFTLGEVDVEVWGLMTVHTSNVSPRATLSARPEAGLSFGAERFSAEWGSSGLLLVKPSSGSVRRMVRLGTVTLPVDLARPARWKLWLACSTAAGSTGTFGCDYLVCCPSRYRAASPSRKTNDSTYPKFVTSTAETSKTILSDLRGLVAKPPLPATGDKGLGGTPLELPAGNVDLLVKLSSLVPDDQTSDTTTEQLAHTAAVHVAVWPRFNGLRSA
jgi:hypothetical protein